MGRGRSEARQSSDRVDHPRVALIGLAHFTNDLSGNFLTSLTPYLVLRGAISATVAGLVVFVYLIGSSVLQPAFGILSDRHGRRWFAVIGPFWLSIAAAFTGWIVDSWQLLALAAIGGLGTAAFHPQAATMVDALSPRAKGRSMAVFTMGGNLGFAFGPVAAAGVALAGLHWSILLVVPGAAIAILLGLYAPPPQRRPTPLNPAGLAKMLRGRWTPLALIVSVIALRSAVQLVLIIFLPLYYHARGLAPETGSYLAFLLSFAGAAGGYAGGYLSDLHGRRVVNAATLIASAPVILLALAASGIVTWPLIAVAGALLLASNSVLVVQAQALLPEHTGLASGLTLGLGFGLSGLLTALLTALADATSVSFAVFVIPSMALIAGGLSLLVKETRVPAALPAASRDASARVAGGS